MMGGTTVNFTSWLRNRKQKSDLSNLLESYTEEDWWPHDGITLSDFIIAARKIVPIQLIVCCYNEYRNETNGYDKEK